jgi:hypothetical protein
LVMSAREMKKAKLSRDARQVFEVFRAATPYIGIQPHTVFVAAV